MMKCDSCLNSRTVVSENGRHPVCCLSEKQAMNCLMGKDDKYVTIQRPEEKSDELKM